MTFELLAPLVIIGVITILSIIILLFLNHRFNEMDERLNELVRLISVKGLSNEIKR